MGVGCGVLGEGRGDEDPGGEMRREGRWGGRGDEEGRGDGEMGREGRWGGRGDGEGGGRGYYCCVLPWVLIGVDLGLT